MKTILCIDLDHTLLDRDEDMYIPESYSELSRYISSIPNEQCISRIDSASNSIIFREASTNTLLELFMDEFCKGFEDKKEKITAEFFKYYDNDYHLLQQYTSPIPEGIQLIHKAIQLDYKIVIATNPFYPLNALEQRLRWAGLTDYLKYFSFITTIEDFHFVKPDPAYYVEILGRLGWHDDTRVYMIGDSLENDVIPAVKAGIPAYWLGNGQLPTDLQQDCSSGSYEGFFDWIDKKNREPKRELTYCRDLDLVANLKGTPAVFDTICRSVSSNISHKRPEIQEWSLVEIICHLRDMDRDVNIPRFIEAFQQENPFISHIDTASWADERNYREENSSLANKEFAESRLELIRLLVQHQDEWKIKKARHSIFGSVCLGELIQFIVTHDRMHIRQAYDTLNQVNIHS